MFASTLLELADDFFFEIADQQLRHNFAIIDSTAKTQCKACFSAKSEK
jgi:hypothetical protein